MSDENQNGTQEQGAEQKQSNRTFSQSEYDKGIADAKRKAEERLKEFDEKLARLNALEAEKAKKDEAEMNAAQLAQKRADELAEKLAKAEAESIKLRKSVTKAEVLADPKYAILPSVYRLVIDGDTPESVKEAADNAVAEWKEELKRMGVKTDSPPPPIGKQNNAPPTQADLLKQAIEKRFRAVPGRG